MYSVPISTQPVQPMGSAATAAFAVISTVLFGTGTVYGLDRSESWRYHIQPRVAFTVDTGESSGNTDARPDVRTAVEHLENIRKVLNPQVADLASLFDVSRQAIYKWLAGTSMPEDDKFDRIVQLSRIADAFQSSGVSRAGTLLKMKTFGGRSLMELIASREVKDEHVAALIAEAKAMERSYQRSGLTTSKSQPTNDWQSSVSIPGSPEHG